jgi:hypothetical protein
VTTKAVIIDAIRKVMPMVLPVWAKYDVVERECDDVPLGSLRVALEYPRSVVQPSAGVGTGQSKIPVPRWNSGEREACVTRPLYALGHIEPYITWAGEIAWRATDDGKQAGLK